MDILNDLTRCNFYYYILRSDKAYLIFKYLQLTDDYNCIGDALIRRQNIKIYDNKSNPSDVTQLAKDQQIVRVLNKNLKDQYNIINNLKLNKNIDLDKKLIDYSNLGYLLVIQYLVSLGANIHSNTDDALRWAAKNGHLQLLQYLVSKGANIHTDNNYALQDAVENGHLKIVKYLLAKGMDIHALDDEALKYTVEDGHLNMIQYLVSIGVNIYTDYYLLSYAANNDYLELVQYLVSIGANTDSLTAAQKLQFNIN